MGLAMKFSNLIGRGRVLATSAAVVVVSSPALVFAQSSGTSSTAPDFSVVTSAIDWSSVITGILAAATAAVVVYIAMKGAKWVLSAVRGL